MNKLSLIINHHGVCGSMDESVHRVDGPVLIVRNRKEKNWSTYPSSYFYRNDGPTTVTGNDHQWMNRDCMDITSAVKEMCEENDMDIRDLTEVDQLYLTMRLTDVTI